MRSAIFLLPFLFASVSATCTLVEQNDPTFGKRTAAYCAAHKATYTTQDAADAAVVAEATTYWTAQGGKDLSKVKDVEILFSFGSNDSPSDTQRTGFTRVANLIKKMSEQTTVRHAMGHGAGTDTRFYLDAIALTKVPGAFWKPNLAGYANEAALIKPVSEGGSYPLNLYWSDYYKDAMAKAKYMVFLLTEGWYNSKWCGEELDWASGSGASNRKTATMTPKGQKNFVVLLDQKAVTEFPKTTDTTASKATKAKWGLIGITTADQIGGVTMTSANFQTILTKIIDGLGLTKKSLLELSASPAAASKHFKNETTTAGFLEASAHFKKKLKVMHSNRIKASQQNKKKQLLRL